MTWEYLHSCGTAPPSGWEVWKMATMHLDIASETISSVPTLVIIGIGQFEFCKMLYFMNAFAYPYDIWYVHHALKVIKKFMGSATLWSKL